MAYMYIITPKDISTKLAQTRGFLRRKLDEFERLKAEIEILRQKTEVRKMTAEFTGNTGHMGNGPESLKFDTEEGSR